MNKTGLVSFDFSRKHGTLNYFLSTCTVVDVTVLFSPHTYLPQVPVLLICLPFSLLSRVIKRSKVFWWHVWCTEKFAFRSPFRCPSAAPRSIFPTPALIVSPDQTIFHQPHQSGVFRLGRCLPLPATHRWTHCRQGCVASDDVSSPFFCPESIFGVTASEMRSCGSLGRFLSLLAFFPPPPTCLSFPPVFCGHSDCALHNPVSYFNK